MPVLVCGLMLGVFSLGLGNARRDTDGKDLGQIESAVRNGCLLCYAVEGKYPRSIEYLIDQYGLCVDLDRYYVGYKVEGANLMPDIRVMER